MPKTNTVRNLMIDDAGEQNLSNCWICQNMPCSMHSTMFNPIPFIKVDYRLLNWNDLASKMEEGADHS